MDLSKFYDKFGLYQALLFLQAALMSMINAFTVFLHVFLSENHEFRCFVPSCDDEMSTYNEPWLNRAIPSKHGHFSSCLVFASNNTNLHTCDLNSFDINKTQQCSNWIFESEHETLARKWGLLCDKEWLWDSAESIFMGGLIVSNFIVGVLSDRIGRKKAFIIISIGLIIFCIAKSVSPNFTFYLVINFFVGVFYQITLPSYTLFFESTNDKMRAIFGMGLGITYAIGELILALVAYYFPYWKWLLMFACYSFFITIFYFFLLPESIEWLASTGKKEQLKKELMRLVKCNKLPYESHQIDDEVDAHFNDNKHVDFKLSKSSAGPFVLFKTSYLAKCTILQMIIWFCVSLVYFGVTFESKNIGSDYIVTFALLSAVEIPGIFLSTFALMKFGRKNIQIILLIICAIVCIVNIFIIPGSMVQTVLAVIGKGCVAAQWGVNVIYTVELFPTPVRNMGYGYASTCARVSAIVASYISDLAGIYEPLPMIIFGSCAFIACIAMFFLPETANKPLMHSIEQTMSPKRTNVQRSKSIDTFPSEDLNIENVASGSQQNLSVNF